MNTIHYNITDTQQSLLYTLESKDISWDLPLEIFDTQGSRKISLAQWFTETDAQKGICSC